MDLAEHLAKALAKYQENEPWETLTDQQKARHLRLGALLAAEVMKRPAFQSPSPSPASTTPPTPSPQSPRPALDATSLSHAAAVEVSVAVQLTVGGVTGALSIKSVQDIWRECLKQIEKEQKEQQHVSR